MLRSLRRANAPREKRMLVLCFVIAWACMFAEGLSKEVQSKVRVNMRMKPNGGDAGKYHLQGQQQQRLLQEQKQKQQQQYIRLQQEQQQDEQEEEGRLTHVLMPFHVKQTEEAIGNMQSWRTYLPCTLPTSETVGFEGNATQLLSELGRVGATVRRGEAHGLQLGRGVWLELLVAADPSQNNVTAQLVTAYGALPECVRQCFAGVNVHYITLRGQDDEYPRGSRLMFEHMLRGAIPMQRPHYLMFMEPDCRPVRPAWLAQIDALTRWPNPDFWIRGSVYMGYYKYVPSVRSYYFHINGNGLFNMRDPRFPRFYFQVVQDFINSTNQENPYDIEIFRAMWEKHNWGLSRLVYPKLLFSDAIFNMWHTHYSRKAMIDTHENLVIIHGGYPRP